MPKKSKSGKDRGRVTERVLTRGVERGEYRTKVGPSRTRTFVIDKKTGKKVGELAGPKKDPSAARRRGRQKGPRGSN